MIRLSAFLVVIGCTGSSATSDETYATFQACWDEHTTVETFSAQKAIEVCCIVHPIGSEPANMVCGTTASSCETYVSANLSTSSATADDVTAACSAYVVDRGG
jgi:hypothetical protein